MKFGKEEQKSHYITGNGTFDFNTCFLFDSSLEEFQSETITIYVMSDKGFAHKPFLFLL